MANPEHVALVRKGTEAIDDWRRAHPDERLDLSGAELQGADLSHADLVGADLIGANLIMANLSRADLGEVDLRAANLSGANLAEANLAETDLSSTNLAGADLSDANLIGANLTVADLSDANLIGANLMVANLRTVGLSGARLPQASIGYTSLSDLDLNRVEGLANVQHFSPSSVGVDTLITSIRGAGDKLPELMVFFRSAGVPPELLDALPDIVREVKYYSCFISYGQPDLEFAKKLTEDLRAKSVSCWLYDKDKTVGKPTWGEIEQKLDEHERIVVLCSIRALIREGFKKEIDKQIDKDPDKLIPVSLDDDWKQHGFKAEWAGRDLKTWLLERNYADFANKPYEEALEELLKGLKRKETRKRRRKVG